MQIDFAIKVYYLGKPVTVESVQKDTVVIKITHQNGFGFRRVHKNEIITESDFLGNRIPNCMDSDLAF